MKKAKSTYETIGTSECIATFYALLPFFHFYGTILARGFLGVVVFTDSTESYLAVLQLGELVFTILLGVLPSQIDRCTLIRNNDLLNQKRTFVRYVSHEIRSPLNVVSAGLELLSRELTNHNMSSETLEIVRDISESTALSIETLNELLHYESMDAGTFKLEEEEIPVSKAVPKNLNHLRVLARARKVDLTIETIEDTDSLPQISSTIAAVNGVIVSPDLYFHRDTFVRIDEYRFDQVARNLVTNAVKFCPPENGLVEVKIFPTSDVTDVSSAEVAGARLVGSLRLEVSDNGAGISKESQAQVFREFSQFKKNKLQGGGGSGLGLWISREIVRLHGGTLNFKSEGEGKGCNFYVCLPIYRRSESTFSFTEDILKTNYARIEPEVQARDVEVPEIAIETAVLSNPFVPPYIPRLGSLRILVVDDSHLNRKIFIKTILAEDTVIINPTIEEADDGDDAVVAVRKSMEENKPFDVVFMDSNMNRMHGPAAATAMRDELDYRGQILGITGDVLADEIQHYLRCGANQVLAKPIKTKRLLEVMREVGLL